MTYTVHPSSKPLPSIPADDPARFWAASYGSQGGRSIDPGAPFFSDDDRLTGVWLHTDKWLRIRGREIALARATRDG
jgi:hypothetical protein